MRTAWKPCIKFLILAGLVDGIRKLGRGILTVVAFQIRNEEKKDRTRPWPYVGWLIGENRSVLQSLEYEELRLLRRRSFCLLGAVELCRMQYRQSRSITVVLSNKMKDNGNLQI